MISPSLLSLFFQASNRRARLLTRVFGWIPSVTGIPESPSTLAERKMNKIWNFEILTGARFLENNVTMCALDFIIMGGNFYALLESTFDAVIVVSSADLRLGRKWKCKICDLWERESSSVLFQQTGHIFTLHSRLQQKIVCKYWQRKNHCNLACFGCLLLIFLESNIHPLW